MTHPSPTVAEYTVQRLLQAGDTLVVETGNCLLQMPRLRLPAGVSYQAQTLWGSIGLATPATLGIALADGGKRVILVTGDGAHQCTANDLGAMGRYGIQPIIFVLNNGLYGVEEVVGEKGHVNDRLVAWDYPALPAAMGCKDWFTAHVTTVGELDAAIAKLIDRSFGGLPRIDDTFHGEPATDGGHHPAVVQDRDPMTGDSGNGARARSATLASDLRGRTA